MSQNLPHHNCDAMTEHVANQCKSNATLVPLPTTVLLQNYESGNCDSLRRHDVDHDDDDDRHSLLLLQSSSVREQYELSTTKEVIVTNDETPRKKPKMEPWNAGILEEQQDDDSADAAELAMPHADNIDNNKEVSSIITHCHMAHEQTGASSSQTPQSMLASCVEQESSSIVTPPPPSTPPSHHHQQNSQHHGNTSQYNNPSSMTPPATTTTAPSHQSLSPANQSRTLGISLSPAIWSRDAFRVFVESPEDIPFEEMQRRAQEKLVAFKKKWSEIELEQMRGAEKRVASAVRWVPGVSSASVHSYNDIRICCNVPFGLYSGMSLLFRIHTCGGDDDSRIPRITCLTPGVWHPFINPVKGRVALPAFVCVKPVYSLEFIMKWILKRILQTKWWTSIQKRAKNDTFLLENEAAWDQYKDDYNVLKEKVDSHPQFTFRRKLQLCTSYCDMDVVCVSRKRQHWDLAD
mmetsp:Transcript_9996/g.37291  ORF Transcript_9996/g.37291 Transcript_9996/m.37291 type:complete len:463 (-) Transcript_9996:4077-5465(-)|eukprot:CAMPEP_0117447860 /NCGR_PEP_ID=MMETSP0759-20121206/7095_1 /TAXON_ID=63605 /ORGANISM="Percolomonas cosmopolitus, Strain WS" /LENGTH=462 /DNA_ID=CAMNT_0005240213 /DNA_START=266 /DNA_END=1654 /DNA_ORIENTATION=-